MIKLNPDQLHRKRVFATMECAKCGTKGRDKLSPCPSCRQAWYCNATCRRKHQKQHKEECKGFLTAEAGREEPDKVVSPRNDQQQDQLQQQQQGESQQQQSQDQQQAQNQPR